MNENLRAATQSLETSRTITLSKIISGCACLLLAGCATLTEMELDNSPAEHARYAGSHNLQAEVDSLARPLVEQGETPGIVVGVLLPDGSTAYFGYGTIMQGKHVKPDGDTIFPIGSLSKGFLGAMATSLVEEGVLSWDDTLGKLLPADTPLSPDAKKITLLQLATHTSGLPRQPITFQTFRYFVQFLFTGENFYRHFDRKYVFDYLSDFTTPKQVEPRYSNIGYGLLGHVIELRTGQPLNALMEKMLAQPLALKNTGYAPELLPGYVTRALGHAGDQPKFLERGTLVPDWEFTNLMKGSAGVYSSARDLLTFAAAHLDGHKTKLSTALADTMEVRFARAKDAPAVAWVVDDIDGQRITYQVGLVAGYTSYLGVDVEHRTAVVVLQNSFNWKGKIGHKLLTRLAYTPPLQTQ
jgi:CubicO group peptidase (beta-lactamase class C family)